MDFRRPLDAALLGLICSAFAVQGTARAAEAHDDAYVIPPRLTDYDLSSVDRHVEGALDRYSGGSCFIVIKDGRTLLRKAYGTYTLDKVVSIASASKWLSGGVIMALVDEGKLSLDDTAGTFFSDFTGNKAGITVRQCFSHTSGFPFSTPNDFDPPRYSPNQDKSLASMQACVDIIATIPLDPDCDPPGSGFYYSGIGMQVAARMGEIRKEDGWQNIFMEKIGTPLSMTATDYYGSGFTNNPNAAGGIQANVDDLGKFVWMVANRGVFEGKRVLSEEAVETMLTNQTGNPPIVSSPATGLEEYAGHGVFRYGVGCWLERFDPDTGKGWEASSPGAFGCVPFVDLKRNLAGAFLPRTVGRFTVPGGGACNEGHAVYLEAKQMIQSIIPEDPVLAVLQNDAGGVRILSVSQPAHGTAVNHRSHVTYTPETGYVGADSFTYTLDLGGGAPSAPATVTINVNTKPEAEIPGSGTYTVEEGELLALAGSGSDAEDGTNVTFDWD
ncbi:MAG: serine hydrolase [Planctomycetes bacterium]|nr:serine hydrolase [Planctomycetota bacterium]